ncbi:Gfo/Idh/MocA family oxidoreductase [Nanchangia anserum]|uniref:Gfo/Idh/MocA family oxidoreductase n=1 Tax=Nanchangia anserum TaxID=2692125 RepID=A0A8I0KUI5_9ACTO|nr:Gfo/Idh/MocA family oxidoreductase [Nanchangia anserum]MBD3689738.1 Gfo/Idh/MocA family oxidoreductase [Nanchangia anserum]QOX81910.1 Gfo/Idh/MocA family oxidoreductase [Nanchangia anserum]
MSDKLRIGIIGLGFIGTQKHLVGLSQHLDRCDMVAFCDYEIDRAEKAQKEYGSDDSYACTDYRKVVDDPSIDVVHVCTWNVNHCEITCAALEAGKHVLVEKPMAVTGEDARKMVETAKRTGKKLSVGFQYRFRKEAQFLRKVVDEGRLGEIYAAKAHAIRRRGVPIWGVFTDKEKQGGGPLIDLGGHAIDQALWYMDNYEVAQVVGVVNYKLGDKPEGNMAGPWDPETYSVEDSAFGFVTFKNGASLFVEASWALNVQDSREGCVTLCGTEGGADTVQAPAGSDLIVTLNNVQGGELVKTHPEAAAAYFGAGGDAMSGFEYMGGLEAGAWLDAILDDTEPYVTAEQACVVTEILDAIYKSAENGGKPVVFD